MHITKSELKETIKEEIRNYLLLERDLTQVKDPKTLSMADRAKRAEQMRAKRAKAQKTKEPSTWDAIKGFFTDVESEEATADRDYAGRKRDADDLEKAYGTKAASTISPDVGKTEKEIAAAHKKKIGSRAVGAGAQTDVRNYYYNFFMARFAGQGLAWATKWLGSERITKPIRDIVQKNAKALAMRVAAKAGLTAMGGPLAPKLLIALTVAEMAPFIAEIQQDVSRHYKGQRSGATGNLIKNLRQYYLFPLRKLMKEKGPEWINSHQAGLVRADYLATFNDDGYMDIVRNYRAGGSFGDVKGVDEQLPEYAIRILNLINKLGPKNKRRSPPASPKKQDKLRRDDRVASASKPKKKKLTRKQYKRKFRNIMRKAGTKYGKNGKWTGLPRQHPARVAYRDFARINRKVPSGIQSELRSLGLLT